MITVAVTIGFKSYTGDPRKLEKTFTEKGALSAEVWGACSRAQPVFLVTYSSAVAESNYMYVTEWGKYYRITNVELEPGERCRVTGILDAIMTYAAQIKTCPGTAIRSETAGINYTVDTSLPLMQGAEYATTKIVPGTAFSETGAYHYLLTLK